MIDVYAARVRVLAGMEYIKLIGLEQRTVSKIYGFLNNLECERVANLDQRKDVLELCGYSSLCKETALFNELCVRLTYHIMLLQDRPVDRGLLIEIDESLSEIRKHIRSDAIGEGVAMLMVANVIRLNIEELSEIVKNASAFARQEVNASPSCISDRGFICVESSGLKAIEKNIDRAKENAFSYRILSVYEYRRSDKTLILNELNRLMYLCILGIEVINVRARMKSSNLEYANRCRTDLLDIVSRKRGFGSRYLGNLLSVAVEEENAVEYLQRLGDDLCVFEDALPATTITSVTLQPSDRAASWYALSKTDRPRAASTANTKYEHKRVHVKQAKHMSEKLRRASTCSGANRYGDHMLTVNARDVSCKRGTGRSYGCLGSDVRRRDAVGRGPDVYTASESSDDCGDDSVDKLADEFGRSRYFYDSRDHRGASCRDDASIDVGDSSCDKDKGAVTSDTCADESASDGSSVGDDVACPSSDSIEPIGDDGDGYGSEETQDSSESARFVFVPPMITSARDDGPFSSSAQNPARRVSDESEESEAEHGQLHNEENVPASNLKKIIEHMANR
uniref:M32 n=1 Tax=Hipposideros bat herpesvirus TaxID=3141919 RepID=A0AAU7E208_9VIRU